MYIKIVIKGETILVAIIPIGLKELKNFSEIGIVKICALLEADNDEEIVFGKKKSYIDENIELNNKIPAKAL